jgi:hypothetical protein
MTPKIITRLTLQLAAKGVDNAAQVARDHLTKSGILRPGTDQLTFYGSQREALGPAGRAKDRAAHASRTHSPSDYQYDPKTNRATLKK